LDGLKKGGQEHDIRFDPAMGRVFKVTRSGVFGLSPGVDLDLVAASEIIKNNPGSIPPRGG